MALGSVTAAEGGGGSGGVHGGRGSSQDPGQTGNSTPTSISDLDEQFDIIEKTPKEINKELRHLNKLAKELKELSSMIK